MTSIIKQPRTWHRASEKAGRAQIADVARRAGDIDAQVIAALKQQSAPSYFQAKPTRSCFHNRGSIPVPVVAICPDGTVEHYESQTQAAEAMGVHGASVIGHCLSNGRICRDRRWYRAGTYRKEQTTEVMR